MNTYRSLAWALTMLAIFGVAAPSADAADPESISSVQDDAVRNSGLEADDEVTSEEDVERWNDFERYLEEVGALGSYVDEDGVVVVVVPSSGSSHFNPSSGTSFDLDLRTERRDIEPEDVAEIARLVERVDWRPRVDGYFYPGASFNGRTGQVDIFGDAPAALFADIIRDFKGKVNYTGEVLALSSRPVDVEPHYGGAQMDWPGFETPYDCTSGFAVMYDGEERMTTAGHCFLLGSSASVISLGAKNAGYSEYSFGLTREWYPFPGVDTGLVGGPNVRQAPYIYVGGVNSNTRRGVASARDATGLDTGSCFSGATSGSHCGFTLENSNYTGTFDWFQYRYSIPHIQLWRAQESGDGTCFGDSGGPFYSVNGAGNAIIHGTVTGASLPGGGDDPCENNQQTRALITKWSLIKNAYYPALTLQKI